MSRERILVADDHDALRRGIARALRETGHEVEEAANGNAAIEQLHNAQFDVVLCDLKMGGSDGLDVLRTAKALHAPTAVILMTAFGSVQTAVEAMQIGAFDYVQKPFEIEEMELKIDKALEVRRLKHEIDYLRHTQPDIYEFDRIVGASGALQRVLDIVRKVAKTTTTVLIRGETGTGKELIAGALHHNSLRANRNFVRVNCAALQENLLESELFGHEKGAFTGADRQRVGRFEQADGGSLFLDEVGDMSQQTQAKILRVLQEQEFERLGGTHTISVDVRLVAATNRNLAEMVATGEFREDLYYRVYPGFPTLFWGLSGFCVGDLMGKALWKLVENAARFPRRGGRVLCVHGAVSFHRARPCGPRWLPGRGAMRHVELDRRVLGLQSTGE